jgi:hypothetical protein
MRYTPDDEVCITTVVVKGPGASLRAAEQHELVARALAQVPGARGRAQAMQSRTLSAWAPGAPGPRTRGDRWHYLYLVASALFLALAVLFGYLAFK